MKKTINGIRYDTNSAEMIGTARAGCSTADFSYWEAALYKTVRSGRYFLAGSGGPMTMFSRTFDGNCHLGGDGIIPIDEDHAFEWVQQHLPEDVIDEHFSHLIELA